MRAEERQEHVVVHAAGTLERQHLPADRGLALQHAELDALARHGRVHLDAAAQQDLGGLERLVREHDRGAVLDDPGLLAGDRRDVGAEVLGVVEVDRRARRRPGRRPRSWRPRCRPCRSRRPRRRPGRRRSAAYAIAVSTSKYDSRGPPASTLRRSTSPRYGAMSSWTAHEALHVDRLAVEADPLAHRVQVRAGEQAGAQAERAQQRLDHARGRGLAVGARDVDDRGRRVCGSPSRSTTPRTRSRVGSRMRLRPAGREVGLDREVAVEQRVGRVVVERRERGGLAPRRGSSSKAEPSPESGSASYSSAAGSWADPDRGGGRRARPGDPRRNPTRRREPRLPAVSTPSHSTSGDREHRAFAVSGVRTRGSGG